MPTRYLSADQRARFGHFDGDIPPDLLARHFVLDHIDLRAISAHRGLRNRLGYATLLSSVRFIGTFPDKAEDVPPAVLSCLRAQLGIEEPVGLAGYFQSGTFEWRLYPSNPWAD